MEKIISVSVMRSSDAAAIQNGTPSKLLMYRAGLGIFQCCRWNGHVTIVAGSGNNAGDGYVLALLLRKAGVPCTILLTSEKFSADGAYYFEKCLAQQIPVTKVVDFSSTDIIVDCLLGTGFQGKLRPPIQQLIEQINAASAKVISVDINSGMHGDTGEGFCVQSDITVSIGYLKLGLLLGFVRGNIKTLYNCDIEIPCKGPYLPISNEISANTLSFDFDVPIDFDKLMNHFRIQSGTPAQRLQQFAKYEIQKGNLQFFHIQGITKIEI